jgi:hypothetical protein
MTGVGDAMDWKNELDALVRETMAFVKSVEGPKDKPVMTPPAVLLEALAEPSRPNATKTIAPPSDRLSERDEIMRRVLSFKAHQEKMAREREDYCSRTIAKVRAIIENRIE